MYLSDSSFTWCVNKTILFMFNDKSSSPMSLAGWSLRVSSLRGVESPRVESPWDGVSVGWSLRGRSLQGGVSTGWSLRRVESPRCGVSVGWSLHGVWPHHLICSAVLTSRLDLLWSSAVLSYSWLFTLLMINKPDYYNEWHWSEWLWLVDDSSWSSLSEISRSLQGSQRNSSRKRTHFIKPSW